jgi:hypothetical protein
MIRGRAQPTPLRGNAFLSCSHGKPKLDLASINAGLGREFPAKNRDNILRMGLLQNHTLGLESQAAFCTRVDETNRHESLPTRHSIVSIPPTTDHEQSVKLLAQEIFQLALFRHTAYCICLGGRL